MTIGVDIAEAAERLDELIDLALSDDEVVICSNGRPVAVIETMPGRGQGRTDAVRFDTGCRNSPDDHWQTSNHEYVHDLNGLPK
ncbi:hypothetical protein ATY81_07565 [Rhizobium sp. R72]|nr:hypothetical protein ATY81_07565 [Rhizobium sp. R72]OWV97931.1 hypothetical protein ATY80_07565 [Rhizobium sp. R711]